MSKHSPLASCAPVLRSLNDLFFTELFEGALGEQKDMQWRPAVDIKEEEERYVVTADLPGVELSDVEITMDKGALLIKGERKQESSENKNGYHRVERSYGSFIRRFNFPDNVDVEKIEASGKDGVLTVTIPKGERAMPRKIVVG